MTHFAHYVRRQLVELNYEKPSVQLEEQSAPWYAENQPDTHGLNAPSYHITRSKSGPATRVSEGDTIWLFSQLETRCRKFPPALDAKILVQRVSRVTRSVGKKESVIRYEAGSGSKWFPLYNAASSIQQLYTRDSVGNIRALLSRTEQPIWQALQGMRELTEADPLLELEMKMKEMSFDFISYRLIDGTQLACDKAIQLVNDGGAIFWDRWSLPRRLAERREFLNDQSLDDHISKQIKQCNFLWAIQSERYAEIGSYSAREMYLAQHLNKLKFVTQNLLTR